MRTIRGAPVIRPNQWVDAVAMAAPASVQFGESASRATRFGFSVDSFTPWAPPSGDFPEDYGLNVRIGLRGNEGLVLSPQLPAERAHPGCGLRG